MTFWRDADSADKRIMTVQDHLDVYPDIDPFGVPYDDEGLRRELERLSVLALTPASPSAFGPENALDSASPSRCVASPSPPPGGATSGDLAA